MKKAIALAAMAVVVGTGSKAMAAEATGTASASIATAIGITNTTSLNFGTVAASATTAGTVVVATNGGVTDSNVVRQSGSTTQGVVTVTGAEGASYAITVPTSVTLNRTGGGTMTVDTFTHDSSGTVGTGGTGTVNIGATLQVGQSQTAGTYTGDYTITVNYN